MHSINACNFSYLREKKRENEENYKKMSIGWKSNKNMHQRRQEEKKVTIYVISKKKKKKVKKKIVLIYKEANYYAIIRALSLSLNFFF